MNFRTPAFGPDAAEPGPIKRDVALALPVLRLSILTANSEMDGRRSRPFPFAQKLFQPVRAQRNQGVWAIRAADIETKTARGDFRLNIDSTISPHALIPLGSDG